MGKVLFFLVFVFSVFAESHYLLMGAPGSGKGTFSQFMLKEKPEVYVHLCVGDLLRNEVALKTPIGREIQSQVESGALVPTTTTFFLLKRELLRHLGEGKYVILDGLVQSQENIDLFDELLLELKLKDQFRYIYFHIEKELANQRISSRRICSHCGKISQKENKGSNCSECGHQCEVRPDDNPATIARRLTRFYEQIEPLIEQYRSREGFLQLDSCEELDKRLDDYRKHGF